MSNIYIQEPPTQGKVLLKTSVGEIDIELWARETPKTCRNFIQLCLEGYYDNTIFHRVVKGFIVQGGDPTGTGEGGESIYGQPFKDEFHSRLRFVRRGLIAMANSDKDDNGSQFFFTLGPASELQNKHTVFGKVTGNTLYNMLKLEEGLVDRNERPIYPNKITSAVILNNPFTDIVPRVDELKLKGDQKECVKSKSAATKNFKLLSFGEEAEEDEEEVNEMTKKFEGKSKSVYDLVDDSQLTRKTNSDACEGEKEVAVEDEKEQEEEISLEEKLNQVRKKLQIAKKANNARSSAGMKTVDSDKKDAIRKEIKQLKRDLAQGKKKSEKTEPEPVKEEEEVEKETMDKYEGGGKKKRKKEFDREAQTLELLGKFQKKLQSIRQTDDADEIKEKEELDEDNQWLSHTLTFDTKDLKVKDANVKDEDTYEIYDPRNPINQRRREASKHTMKQK
uniref:Spliceosome-associated protein CWC27 homolog n=1 Tax=Strigamia maritima TaxID=126957 RepID=T1JEY8_STRMM